MRPLLILAAGTALLAQGPPPNKVDQDQPIKVDVDVVSILASVRDKKGALIPNLEKQDFTVLEDGKPQEIKYFTREVEGIVGKRVTFDQLTGKTPVDEIQSI